MIITGGVILSQTFISGWFSGKKKYTEITDEKTRLVFEDLKKRLSMEDYEIDLELGGRDKRSVALVQSYVSISGKKTVYILTEYQTEASFENQMLRELIRIKQNHDVKKRVMTLAMRLIFGVTLTALWGVVGIVPALLVSYFVTFTYREVRQIGLEGKIELKAAKENTLSELDSRIRFVIATIEIGIKKHLKEVSENKKRWKFLNYDKNGNYMNNRSVLNHAEVLGILMTEKSRKLVAKTPA